MMRARGGRGGGERMKIRTGGRGDGLVALFPGSRARECLLSHARSGQSWILSTGKQAEARWEAHPGRGWARKHAESSAPPTTGCLFPLLCPTPRHFIPTYFTRRPSTCRNRALPREADRPPGRSQAEGPGAEDIWRDVAGAANEKEDRGRGLGGQATRAWAVSEEAVSEQVYRQAARCVESAGAWSATARPHTMGE